MFHSLEIQLPPNTNNAFLKRLKSVLSISNEQMMREYWYTHGRPKTAPRLVTSHGKQAIRRNHRWHYRFLLFQTEELKDWW